MASWRISELSKMTGVSVRMLRHFDKISLFKPAARLKNEYRSYSEKDLALLEQIIALRTFGFSLKEVKAMLDKEHSVLAHLKAQREVVRQKALKLSEVYKTLSEILSHIGPSDSPDTKDLMKLIRSYQMTKDLSKSWAKKHLSDEQFKAYVAIYDKYPEDFAAMDLLIEKINKGECGDPEGPDGEKAIELQLKLIDKTKDSLSEQRHLGADVLKSMKAGQISEIQLSPEGGLWMMRAGFAFWLKRWEKLFDKIVANLHSDPKGKIGEAIAQEWRMLVDQQLCVPPQKLAVGVMLWQETARQKEEYAAAKTMPSPQEMAKKVHVKLLFNPDALQWIEQALMANMSGLTK
jgi:DNA-binding transcriptional MerR regulator